LFREFSELYESVLKDFENDIHLLEVEEENEHEMDIENNKNQNSNINEPSEVQTSNNTKTASNTKTTSNTKTEEMEVEYSSLTHDDDNLTQNQNSNLSPSQQENIQQKNNQVSSLYSSVQPRRTKRYGRNIPIEVVSNILSDVEFTNDDVFYNIDAGMLLTYLFLYSLLWRIYIASYDNQVFQKL
jgi:hypothetical protein